MRILVAPDKFKGSLGAADVAACIAAGLRDVLADAEITCLPVADGGEGTANVICAAKGGAWRSCNVHGPMGDLVPARYCTIDDGETAVMEMSEASGLWRVPLHQRDPMRASSFGTGEMLLAAAERSATKIIIGLGGSATNEGGFGMARALGFRFRDAAGEELSGAVSDLLRLDRLEAPRHLALPEITAAVDVRNRLLGARGATRVFGPQKGATGEQLEALELALERLADVVAEEFGSALHEMPGAGAAGGLGFGLMAFCGATIRSGFDIVAEEIGLAAAVLDADVVITGEGRLDAQTLEGKAPAGVARLARSVGKRTYAIVGQLEADVEVQELFDAIFEVKPSTMTREEAVRCAPSLLRERARELGRGL